MNEEPTQLPTLTTLLTIIRFAHTALSALPPAAVNVTPEAQDAMRNFFVLTAHYNLVPTRASREQSDGTRR